VLRYEGQGQGQGHWERKRRIHITSVNASLCDSCL